LLIAIRCARSGMLNLYLRALSDVLRNAPNWLRSRRQIQRSRTIGAREFERLVRGWWC
jgi:hypothetical protein